jgi:hypothetical protein
MVAADPAITGGSSRLPPLQLLKLWLVPCVYRESVAKTPAHNPEKHVTGLDPVMGTGFRIRLCAKPTHSPEKWIPVFGIGYAQKMPA